MKVKITNIKLYIGCLIAFIIVFAANTSAQSVRSLINDGVENYEQEKYSDSEVNFKKGLNEEYESFEGHFNLGDALYKQERYDEAIKSYQNALALTEDKELQSKVFHNIGNSLVKAEKYKESLGAYKNSLMLNPNDLETKYNLAYALNKLKNNQQQQQQQKQDKDKDKQQNKDQQKQDQNQNQDQQNKQEQQQQKQPQPKPDEISKEEAERILQALKNNEKDIQKKVRKQKGKAVKKAKDW